jgi:hypothetical protein
MMSNPEKDLNVRIKEWLQGEGHPLQFRTTHEFLKRGFTAQQGSYTRASEDAPREVDVLAYLTARAERIRIYHVVECKWSGDKPWVVFTSEMHQMATSACVNQTISSLLGGSIAWILAGDADVPGLGLFACPERGGFGGRQAFSKGNDLFYAALQSVVSKATSVVSEYDERCDLSKALPEWGAIAFPVVVVEGGLFEGYMDWESGELLVQPTSHIRVHWEGSEAWSRHATVDIITDQYVGQFATIRARETNTLLEKMRSARKNIETCWETSSLKPLSFRRAARGTVGLPPILRTISLRESEKRARKAQLDTVGPAESNVEQDTT